MWSKLKSIPLRRVLWITIPAVVLVAVALVGVFVFLLPYMQAANSMDLQGTLVLQEQEDGTLVLHWPAGQNADSYWVSVSQGEEYPVNELVSGTEYTLPALKEDQPVRICVTSGHHWIGGVREGEHALEAELVLTPPVVTELDWTADAQTGKLEISFAQAENMSCQWYIGQAGKTPICIGDIEGGKAAISFGEGKDFPVPEYGADHNVLFAVTLRGENWEFRGKPNTQLVLHREDFLGTGLKVECTRENSNVYVLQWNETKGDRYEVQLSADGENWQTLATVEKTEPHSYTSQPLKAFTKYQFRVVALGGQTLPGSEYAAEPAVVEVQTQERALRSTIWPIQELEVFSDPAMTQPVGKVEAGKAFCLLEEENGAFGILWGEGVGYIDSNFCMINLPEYVGDLCLYDITNSYSSLYMVHEFGIDDVSGKRIKGYEKIKLANGNYVVPLLYPAAKKLVVAGQSAVDQGYRLKIYDSFRPNAATLDVYDRAQKILADPVPSQTFSGKKVDDLDKLSWKPEAGESLPEEETKPAWEGIMEGLTYEILMTDNGRWGLYNFLAQGVSNHNRGIAMDLTLVTLEGRELKMQTSMHDLSWYSEAARNNNNAYILRKIMVDAGFGGLGSEWWHYQDNDARDNLKPPSLYWGVNMECWMYEGDGWRYRTSDGKYLTDCTQIIHDTSYRFDSQGIATIEQ